MVGHSRPQAAQVQTQATQAQEPGTRYNRYNQIQPDAIDQVFYNLPRIVPKISLNTGKLYLAMVRANLGADLMEEMFSRAFK
mgnify:CR=1 FL=1